MLRQPWSSESSSKRWSILFVSSTISSADSDTDSAVYATTLLHTPHEVRQHQSHLAAIMPRSVRITTRSDMR